MATETVISRWYATRFDSVKHDSNIVRSLKDWEK